MPERDRVEPFLFGKGRLYGCLHHAQKAPVKNITVVQCYPAGHEYIRSHRALYQLAVRLARAGFNVLRFDYSGCGDSGGDYEEGSMLQWTNDVSSAVQEARERTGASGICLVGMRLGATLAVRAACERDDVVSMVLWEPICDGRKYLDELARLEVGFRSNLRLKKKNVRKDGMFDEVIGYPITVEFVKDMEEIDLCSCKLDPGIKVAVIVNGQAAGGEGALDAFIRQNSNSECKVIADRKLWLEELYKRIIPNETLQAIVSWIDMQKP